MADENLQFPIPNKVLEPYIQQAVTSSIVAALGNADQLIASVVSLALAQKVSEDGTVSARYSSDNKYAFCELIAKNKIREIAKETIIEMAEQLRPKIKKQIEKELTTKHSLIAQTLVNGVIESLTSKWSVTVNMSPKG